MFFIVDFIKYYHAEACYDYNSPVYSQQKLDSLSFNMSKLINNLSSTLQETVTLSGISDTASQSGPSDSSPITAVVGHCQREHSLLYLFLMLGTVWLGLSLYNFTKT